MIFWIILFSILSLHYFLFIRTIHKGLTKLYDSMPVKKISYFITLIIPFRNESENILNNLKSIESQNFPDDKFEVIYVNDNSTDDSLTKLRTAIKKSNIKILDVNNTYTKAHKKRAIEKAIQKAKGEIIVTSDADCDYNTDWLETIAGCFDEKTGFVSGSVDFYSDGSIFQDLQQLEFAGLIISGAGLIGAGKPTICSAANIAFLKKAFNLVGGYSDNLNLSSGDDEILMQKIHANTNYRIKFCTNINALVKTKPNRSFNDFFNQRKRWASKGLFYQNKFLIFQLILIFFFFLSIILELLFGLFYNNIFYLLFALFFLMKILVEFFVMKKGSEIIYNRKKLPRFLIAELFHIPYILLSAVSGIAGNFNWKGRKIKR